MIFYQNQFGLKHYYIVVHFETMNFLYW